MKYRFIENHRSEFRVQKMVETLEVSRSGYYQWRRRPESQQQKANKALLSEIDRVYEESKGRYGSPRIAIELKANRLLMHLLQRPILASTVLNPVNINYP